jgi:hypothetical protein
MLRLVRATMLAPAISAALVVLGMAPAGAAVPLPGVVSPAPVSWTPNVFAGTTDSTLCTQWFGGPCKDATVYSTAIVNGEVVVAGAFTQACQPGPASSGHCKAGTLVTRDDLFAYQLGTGVIDPNFTPQLDQGPAYSVVAGPNNTVYVGGAFTTVNGAGHRGIVQLNVTPGVAATDGQVVSTFTGKVSNTVRQIAFRGSALYIGGQFTSADSTPVTDVVRLNATTGALDPTFSMTLSNPANSLPLKVESMALSPDGGTLAIGGTFLDVNGQSRPRVALISTGGGLGVTATLANWEAPIFANNCSGEHDYVRGIDFSPDGSFFVVATTGYKSDANGAASVCDATARFTANVNAGTNVQPAWTNYTGGDSQYSVQVTGGAVYVGGHNRWVNNECGNNAACEANTVLTMGFSAIDANTGLAIAWFHPLTLRGAGVMSLTAFPAALFSGSNGGVLLGDNVTVNGQGSYHSFNAMFPLTSTTSSPRFGSIPSGIFLNGRLGGYDESTTGVAAMCVDDTGDSATPGTTVSFSTCTNGAEQNWTVQPNGNITINGLCLDTVGGGTTTGTHAEVNSCGPSSTQLWSQGAGNTLVNSASGLCLDDPGSATKNGTVLDIATCSGGTNQVWPLPAAPLPASLTPAGAISVQVPSGTAQPACLTDTNNSTTPGTAAEMSICEDSQAQNASIESNGTLQIRGLCLDTSGTKVVLNTCSGASSQVWTPGTASRGHTVVNKASGQCLDAPSQSKGAGLTTATCSPTTVGQQWWLPAV